MAATVPTNFISASTVAIRDPEMGVPGQFDDGVNLGGSCSPGIGINVGIPNIVGTPEQFTLLDQDENARTPQFGQYIGGDALGDGAAGGGVVGINVSVPDVSGDGSAVVSGQATLASLAAGWSAV